MSAYLRSGRGGAGNMYTPEELAAREAQKRAQDPEASASDKPGNLVPDVSAESDELAKAVQKRAEAGAYAHSGRGGAGNYYTPSELEKTGQYTSGGGVTEATTLPEKTNRAWRGRGGAGNFVGEGEEEQKQAEVIVGKEVQGENHELQEVVVKKPEAAHLSAEESK